MLLVLGMCLIRQERHGPDERKKEEERFLLEDDGGVFSGCTAVELGSDFVF